MEAIILAGGLGTRLKAVISDLPKCMAPIAGRPFLEYVLRRLRSNGTDKVILSVGYKHEVIRDHFGTSFDGISISYAIEEEPLGTGGGIMLALLSATENNVFILNGDTLYEVDLAEMQEHHRLHKSSITMALRSVEETARYGSVEIDSTSRIVAFKEKGAVTGPGLINGGVYCVDRETLLNLDFPQRFSFEKDILEKQLLGMSGFISEAYFIDIGIPEDYERAEKEFKDK